MTLYEPCVVTRLGRFHLGPRIALSISVCILHQNPHYVPLTVQTEMWPPVVPLRPACDSVRWYDHTVVWIFLLVLSNERIILRKAASRPVGLETTIVMMRGMKNKVGMKNFILLLEKSGADWLGPRPFSEVVSHLNCHLDFIHRRPITTLILAPTETI